MFQRGEVVGLGGGRFNTQSSLLLLSVGAKHRDGLGVRSVRWFNGRSEAA